MPNDISEVAPVQAPVADPNACPRCAVDHRTDFANVCVSHYCRECMEWRDAEDMCLTCNMCVYHGCCNRWDCGRCLTAYHEGTPCTYCESCTNCCSCVSCPHCRRMHSDPLCENCSNCGECCACDAMNGVQIWRKDGEPTFWNSKKSELNLNPSKRHIAVEIEINATHKLGNEITNAVRKWDGCIVEDGSLPGESSFEINTAPANGNKFVEQINEICAALKTQKAEATKECGLHVHINARDFNFYDIRKLAFLYQKIEPALFNVISPARKKSRYCLPCGDKLVKDLEMNQMPKDNENKILENIYGYQGVRKNEVKMHKYQDGRYAALNLHSWLFRGSIECRMHHGTSDATKIINWGMLWAGILDYAMKNNEADIRALKGDSFGILLQIAPSEEIRNWLVERKNDFSKPVNEARGDL